VGVVDTQILGFRVDQNDRTRLAFESADDAIDDERENLFVLVRGITGSHYLGEIAEALFVDLVHGDHLLAGG
jgi:hypothetical protein